MVRDTGSYIPAAGGGELKTAAVARAFQALPPAQRGILNETVFQNRSVNEAAAFLGVPVEEVKLRVCQALRRLRQELDAA